MANVVVTITNTDIFADLGTYAATIGAAAAKWPRGRVALNLSADKSVIVVFVSDFPQTVFSQDGANGSYIIDSVNGVSGFANTEDLYNELLLALENTGIDNPIEQIARTGELNGKTAYVFNIIGRRAGFTSTSVMNDVKEFDNGVADIPVLSNSTLDILSSDANDTAAGTGVRKVKVVYINNSNNLVQSAEISLNGVTLVTSVLTGVNEVLWMEATSVGSGGVAAGNIRLRINGGTVEVEQITAGGNKSRSARFMVPTGYTAYLTYWDSLVINNDQDMRLRAQVNSLDRSLATVYNFQDTSYVANNSGHTQTLPWLKIPALAKVKVSTISAAVSNTVKADTSFTIVLIAD